MARYAISDIHGCINAFRQLLEKINYTEKDTLYIIGDMIDRGPASMDVVNMIRSHPNMIPIMGNHEWMMLECIDGGPYADSWYSNGNFEVDSYLHILLHDSEDLEAGKKKYDSFVEWIRSLPYWIELDDYLLIHAGWDHYNLRYGKNISEYNSLNDFLSDQDKMDIVWTRDAFYSFPTEIAKPVVYGHTQTYHRLNCKPEDAKVLFEDDKIDIDCGAAYGGKLACLNLDTREVTYATDIARYGEMSSLQIKNFVSNVQLAIYHTGFSWSEANDIMLKTGFYENVKESYDILKLQGSDQISFDLINKYKKIDAV